MWITSITGMSDIPEHLPLNDQIGSHIAPAPKEINERLEKMFTKYNASIHESIIKRIARLHLAFECTHPFNDGNGRISHSNLINKAKRQTIEAFLERGIWKIGE